MPKLPQGKDVLQQISVVKSKIESENMKVSLDLLNLLNIFSKSSPDDIIQEVNVMKKYHEGLYREYLDILKNDKSDYFQKKIDERKKKSNKEDVLLKKEDVLLKKEESLLKKEEIIAGSGEYLDLYNETEKARNALIAYDKKENNDYNYADPIIDKENNILIDKSFHHTRFFSYNDGNIVPLLGGEKYWQMYKVGNFYVSTKVGHSQSGWIDENTPKKHYLINKQGVVIKELEKDIYVNYWKDFNVYLEGKAPTQNIYDENYQVICKNLDVDRYSIQYSDGKSLVCIDKKELNQTKYVIVDKDGIGTSLLVSKLQDNEVFQKFLEHNKHQIAKDKENKEKREKLLYEKTNYNIEFDENDNVIIKNNAGKEIFKGGSKYYKPGLKNTDGSLVVFDSSEKFLFAVPGQDKYYKLNKYSSVENSDILCIQKCNFDNNNWIEETLLINKNTGQQMIIPKEFVFIKRNTIEKFISGNESEIYNVDFELIGKVCKRYDNLHSVHIIGEKDNEMYFVSQKTGKKIEIAFEKIVEIYGEDEKDIFVVKNLDGNLQEIVVEK